MSDSAPGTCPTCHVGVAPGSAFCTRCGAVLPDVTVIAVPVADQQWGGARRRDRRGGRSPAPRTPEQQVSPAAAAVGAGGPYAGSAQYGKGPMPDPVRATQVPWAGGLDGAVQGAPPHAPAQHAPDRYLPASVADAPYGAAGSAPALGAHDVALGPAFDGVSPAGAGRRLGAYALDWLVVWLVGGVVFAITRSPVYTGLAVGELAVGLVVWEARSGKTIGNALLGLRTAKVETPYAPGLGRAVGRAAVLAAAHLGLGVGQWLVVASSAFDTSGRRQGWHDRAARTVVVDVRALRADPLADELPVFQAPVVTAPAAVAPVHPPAPVRPAPVPQSAVPVPPVPPMASLVAPVPPTPSLVAPVQQVVIPPAPDLPPPRVPAPAGPASAVPVPASPMPRGPAPIHPPIASSYVITLDTGLAMTVSGPGYVGRRPTPPDGAPCDHVIAIEDPGRSLSRTHALFGIDGDGFWVEDNHSANGTFVLSADGSSVQGVAGERLVVPAGGTVRLGQRTFTVRPRR